MNKKELLLHINKTYQANISNANTCYSNINKGKEVWWLNIPVPKFTKEVHLLLNTPNYVLWVVLPKGFDISLFKIREDKNAVDLEISANHNHKYLQDVKSGGTGFDFSPFVKEKIVY